MKRRSFALGCVAILCMAEISGSINAMAAPKEFRRSAEEKDNSFEYDNAYSENGDYAITDVMEGNEEDYLILLEDDGGACFMRRPGDRTDPAYVVDEGAYRYEMPADWGEGTCELDDKLSTFWGIEDIPCMLWGMDENTMGANAFSENWEQVSASMEESARTVFGERLVEVSCEKFKLVDGNDVYSMSCQFQSENGRPWMVSAAWRMGERYTVEFIGFNHGDDELNIGNLTLYTAATYEEYGGDRHMSFGDYPTVYKGMEAWEYPMFHNPFALAYEQANGEVWYGDVEAQMIEAGEDYEMNWREEVLPGLIARAVGIDEDAVMYSDVLQIRELAIGESADGDWCIINGEQYDIDLGELESVDLLIQDISYLENLTSLTLQLGDISDYSPLGELEKLRLLDICAGRTVEDMGFLERFPNLQVKSLEKSVMQTYVDSLDADLWERTCREQGITTFKKEYQGEPGLAFDQYKEVE